MFPRSAGGPSQGRTCMSIKQAVMLAVPAARIWFDQARRRLSMCGSYACRSMRVASPAPNTVQALLPPRVRALEVPIHARCFVSGCLGSRRGALGFALPIRRSQAQQAPQRSAAAAAARPSDPRPAMRAPLCASAGCGGQDVQGNAAGRALLAVLSALRLSGAQGPPILPLRSGDQLTRAKLRLGCRIAGFSSG